MSSSYLDGIAVCEFEALVEADVDLADGVQLVVVVVDALHGRVHLPAQPGLHGLEELLVAVPITSKTMIKNGVRFSLDLESWKTRENPLTLTFDPYL